MSSHNMFFWRNGENYHRIIIKYSSLQVLCIAPDKILLCCFFFVVFFFFLEKIKQQKSLDTCMFLIYKLIYHNLWGGI